MAWGCAPRPRLCDGLGGAGGRPAGEPGHQLAPRLLVAAPRRDAPLPLDLQLALG
jgi:hypothetical protein